MIIQMTVKEMKKYFPEAWKETPEPLKAELLSDDKYVARLNPITGCCEYGYPEDTNWKLKFV